MRPWYEVERGIIRVQTEFMVIGTKQMLWNVSHVSVKFNQATIGHTNKARNFGLIFDSTLVF